MRPHSASTARAAAAVVAVVTLGSAMAGCSSPGTSAPPSSTSSSTAVTAATTTSSAPTTSEPVVTTTTVVLPAAPQPSAEGAATALVSSWASGDHARALSVATDSAVATLFAVRYPPGMALDRGCTSAFPPIVCTFGPPGGGPVNAAIYQVSVSQEPDGLWYVNSVQIET